MYDFNFYTPTRVIFGRGTEEKTGELIKEMGYKKILVHYGSGSVKRTGLLDRVEKSLSDSGLEFVELGGVVPNPHLSLVYEGIALCKRENVDFLLAVGGGSVIDSCKAIGYGLANDGDVWDFFDYKREAQACAPIGTILTIAAAGSEMSDSAVITKEEGLVKRGYSSDTSRCKFAIMNPELTMTLPDYQTQSGCTDILMHTMERYLTGGENMELTDGIAEAIMRTVMKNAKILKSDAFDYDARAEVMWAGSLSHNGLTGCGTDGGDWATHNIEHELGGMFSVAHGAGLAAVWGSWARYVYKSRPDRFAKFAVNVLGVKAGKDDLETSVAGIEAMEDFYRSIDMPTSLKELGIDPSDEQMREMAVKCSINGERTVGSVVPLNADDVEKIYHMAKG